jgi:Domain of unknown function (DUF4055)
MTIIASQDRALLTALTSGLIKTHPHLTKYQEQWEVCRTLNEGDAAIMAAGWHKKCSKYSAVGLPTDSLSAKVEENITKEFNAHFNAFRLTVNVYLALLFMKSPTLSAWEEAEDYLKNTFFPDIDGSGTFFNQFAEQVAEEILITNRCGVLVDFPSLPEKMSLSDMNTAAVANVNPILKLFRAENIVSWNTSEDVYGREVLLYVVLRSSKFANSKKDFFELKERSVFTVLVLEFPGFSLLDLYANSVNGDVSDKDDLPVVVPDSAVAVRYDFYASPSDIGSVHVVPDFSMTFNRSELKANGQAVRRIPFYFAGSNCSAEPKPPVFYDLATLNKKHVLMRTRYWFALYHVASPMPFGTGVDPEDIGITDSDVLNTNQGFSPHGSASFRGQGSVSTASGVILLPGTDEFTNTRKKTQKVVLAPNAFLTIKNDTARLGWLTYNGQGLELIERELSNLERQMSILGAKHLNENKKAVQSAQTATIERIGENANINRVANDLSKCVTNCLMMVLAFKGIVTEDAGDLGKMRWGLNVESLPQVIDPQELSAMIQGLAAGVMTREIIVDNLIRRGVIDQDLNTQQIVDTLMEEERAMLPLSDVKTEALVARTEALKEVGASAFGTGGVAGGETSAKQPPKPPTQDSDKGTDTPTGEGGQPNKQVASPNPSAASPHQQGSKNKQTKGRKF